MTSGQIVTLNETEMAVTPAPGPLLMSRSGWHTLLDRAEGILSDYHTLYPLRLAMPREEFRHRLEPRNTASWSPRLFSDILARILSTGRVAEYGGGLRLPDHQVRFTLHQQKAVDRLLAGFRRDPLNTPSMTETLATAGADVVQALLDSRQLVKLSDDVLLLGETYDRLASEIVQRLKAGEPVTVAQIRDRYQTSRKYALALLEYLDAQRITRRVGDARVLR